MEYFSVLVFWGIDALFVDIILENFIENASASYIVSLLIVGFIASLFLTPAGTILLRIQNNLLLPNEAENRRVDHILTQITKVRRKETQIYPAKFVGLLKSNCRNMQREWLQSKILGVRYDTSNRNRL